MGCSGKFTGGVDGEVDVADGEWGVLVSVLDDASRFFRFPAGDFFGLLV